MLALATITNKQDIKSEEPSRKPAAAWLFIPVIAFYIGVLFAMFKIATALMVLIPLLINNRELERETSQIQAQIKQQENTIRDLETTRQYVDGKEKWAMAALPSGLITAKIIEGIPSKNRLLGLEYKYDPPAGQAPGKVTVELQFRGNVDTGQISSNIRQIHPELTMIKNNHIVLEQGTALVVEYTLQ